MVLSWDEVQVLQMQLAIEEEEDESLLILDEQLIPIGEEC